MSTILGFDTATQEVVVGVARDGELVAESRIPPAEDGMPRHSAMLLGEVERLAGEAGGWGAIERIAVGTGPGSYTGLRIGVATARALGQGLGTPLVPVGTLEALALGIAATEPAAGRDSLAVLDARRGQVFALLVAPGSSVRWGPEVLSPEELGMRVAEARSPLAAGSGAVRFRSDLEAAGADVLPDSDRAHRVSALGLCVLAEDSPAARLEEVEPVYLRPPDAERWIQ